MFKDYERWHFDKNYLNNIIVEGKKILDVSKLTRRIRQSIKIDIETFQNYILDDYEMKSLTSYNQSVPNDIDKLKEYILMKMKKQYDILGRDFIIWILNLADSGIFEQNYYDNSNTTELSTSEVVELTIKNYENNFPKFLDIANKIILDDSIKQIHFYDGDDSYCHHDSITGESYILINPLSATCIFNHEVEHAIEDKLMYPTNYFYSELGPVFSEMLFNEELYKNRGYLEMGDFDFRIDEADYLLSDTYSYFHILLMLASKNFNVSTSEFLQLFSNYMELEPCLLIEYLREEIASSCMEQNMAYLFSFLKAIELRELTMNSNNDMLYIFEHYLKNKKFYFHRPMDGYNIYSRYIEEVKQKVRKK